MTINAIVKKENSCRFFVDNETEMFIKDNSIICVSMKEYAIAVIKQLSSRLNNK